MDHVGRITESVNHTKFLFENLIGKDHLKSLGVDETLMLR
jgi:hypothetical protein